MIGTIEALGVFLLAILPGFLGLRVYRLGKPPLRLRGALAELAATIFTSALGWAALYLWRGKELLPLVLSERGHSTTERLDAFAELAALSVVIGLAFGALGRLADSLVRPAAIRVLLRLEEKEAAEAREVALPEGMRRRVERWVAKQIRDHSRPSVGWDRLLNRLVNRGEPVVCRVKTRAGEEVLGVFARAGYLDWEADGRGILLDKEVLRGDDGQLRIVPSSQGVFVPGEEISVLSVVSLPEAAVVSESDG